MVRGASSEGFHLLGSIADCEQEEQEVPGAEPRGDPEKGQEDVESWEIHIGSPVGEQAVSQP